jgi:phospholipid/cholesterol/gamma-HCH transport system substrate-binding protein
MRRERSRRLPSWLIGLVLVIVLAIASLLAFTKQLPWGDAYEVSAVFESAQNVRPSSPVRIAGVNVGEVTEIEHLTSAAAGEPEAQAGDDPEVASDAVVGEQAAVVTMELTEEALPLRSDAQFKLRPRLFLEGNYFVDLQPGSPNAEEVEDGHTFPVNQTAYSVQLDQVLGTLQADVRADLQTFLDQFGNALIKHRGAEGFRELYRTSAPSYKFTSQVNEAFLGTEPGDLGGLIKGLDRVVRGLGRNEQTLQDLVTNFRIFAGSLAAEDVALGRAIEELPRTLDAARPAFANLNASFPALRAFAREALPGTRTAPETLRAATPFIEQVRALVARDELRGLVADLRPTIPRLAKLAQTNIEFLPQARRLSSCFNEVVIPWSHDTVDPRAPSYPHEPVGRVFEETAYGLTGIASESRSGDANGQYIRVQAGGGTNTVKLPATAENAVGFATQGSVGLSQFDILGAMPRLTDSVKTRFEPDVRCETQEPPNLEAGSAAVPFDEGLPDAEIPNLQEVLAELLGDVEIPLPQLRRAALNLGLSAEAARTLAEKVDEEDEES